MGAGSHCVLHTQATVQPALHQALSWAPDICLFNPLATLDSLQRHQKPKEGRDLAKVTQWEAPPFFLGLWQVSTQEEGKFPKTVYLL